VTGTQTERLKRHHQPGSGRVGGNCELHADVLGKLRLEAAHEPAAEPTQPGRRVGRSRSRSQDADLSDVVAVGAGPEGGPFMALEALEEERLLFGTTGARLGEGPAAHRLAAVD